MNPLQGTPGKPGGIQKKDTDYCGCSGTTWHESQAINESTMCFCQTINASTDARQTMNAPKNLKQKQNKIQF
jgi:hypothetical protein